MNRRFIVGLTLCFSQTNFAAIKKETLSIYKPQPIVVAIIDTGADISHPELKDYIWTNEGESGKDVFGNDKESNGVDDDDNGFVDDIHGWNFVDNSNRVEDLHGHGTHISAIIKKAFNNRKPANTSSTSAPSVRLMILKYYDPLSKNQDVMSFSTKAIAYANKMHVQIINYSGGGGFSSAAELAEIYQSKKLGILFVAAAGNEKANTDLNKYYPASYALSNMISVAAATDGGELVDFSNYGSHVDIAAPGKEILSALPHKKFGLMSGTSQATAYVSGAAAKIMASIASSRTKNLRPEETVKEILKLSRPQKSLAGKTRNRLALLGD